MEERHLVEIRMIHQRKIYFDALPLEKEMTDHFSMIFESFVVLFLFFFPLWINKSTNQLISHVVQSNLSELK